MEYVYYLLVVISIFSMLLLLFVRSENLSKENSREFKRIQARKNIAVQKQKAQSEAISTASQSVSPSRQASQAPTPWGWPGHQGHGNFMESSAGRSFSSGNPEVSGMALQQWVDRLLSEKRTVEDQEYLLKKNDSLRALLEDRYGTTNGARNALPGDVESGTEHDQFRSSLKRDARQLTDVGATGSSGKTSELKDIRMPWGW